MRVCPSQRSCVGCGDCVTGCNYGAKNTVLMNYLPDGRNHGAEIFTEVEARHLERDGVAWRVVCETTGVDTEKREIAVTAGIVVLAAGALGSTEILLRSQERGLRISDALGTRFSGNGDTILPTTATGPSTASASARSNPAGQTPSAHAPQPCSTCRATARSMKAW